MLYGLAGAQRTGKSTLALAISQSLSISYVPFPTAEIGRKHGFNVVGDMFLQQRIQLQAVLLEEYLVFISTLERPAIIDRTPLDIAAYLLGEIAMNSHALVTDEYLEAAERLKEIAIKATAEHFDYVFVLGQLDTYEAAEGKPAPNRVYQSHIQLLIEGMIARLKNRVNYATVGVTDKEERIEFVEGAIVERMDELEKQRKTTLYIH